MKSIGIFLGSTVLAMGIGMPASAAPVTSFKFTTFGTISGGVDGPGYFGAKGTDLSGKSFSITTSISLPVDGSGDLCANSAYLNCWIDQGAVDVTAVVDGRIFRTTVAADQARAAISNSASRGNSADPDFISIAATGFFMNGAGMMNINQYITSPLPFVGQHNGFDLIAQHQMQPGYSGEVRLEFDLFGIQDGHVALIASNADIQGFSVPEPSSLALAGMGLVGSLLTRRRAGAKRGG